MSNVASFFASSVGKKFIMAVTGAGLFLFVAGHMIGNLQVFLPPEAINRYAHFLQSNLELLWPVRLVMLAMLGLHAWSAITLSLENRAARPVGYYGNPAPLAASFASRTMLVGGLVVAVFLVYHLLHYTVLVEGINGARVSLRELRAAHDVYAMMIAGFSVWYVSLFYVVGVGLLCLHLSHGLAAMFQSLGWKNHVYGPLIDKAAKVIALALFLGYVSIPVAVRCGHGQAHLRHAAETAAATLAATGEVK